MSAIRIDRIDNRSMSGYVERREPFRNSKSSAYGEWIGEPYEPGSRYVAYSYGAHFPMYIWDVDAICWFGNKDKYSSTTSRHMSCARPFSGADMHELSTEAMVLIATSGVVGHIRERFLESVGG